uniref:Dedicator of cytokinesis 3 n=1 Tax=Esox lucius TaxID=8010 RepID=A0A6Q2X0G6_ESOLU
MWLGLFSEKSKLNLNLLYLYLLYLSFHFASSVICTFRGTVTHGLALEIGETVQILEKCEGHSLFKNDEWDFFHFFSQGIFPTCYVHLKKAIVTNRGQYETVMPLEDPIVTEVTCTLQEWALLWKQLYVKHKVDLFYKLRHVMNELLDLRRQMLSGHLTQDQIKDVKRHITVRLDWGNEHLGLDLVPRKEFEMVDADQISVSDLYKMVSNISTEQININYEKFMVRLNKNGGPKNPEKVDRLCALFTVSCPLIKYIKTLNNYCNNENEWYQIHENIIRKSSTKLTFFSSSVGLIISLQLLRGEMEQLRRENPMIFNRGVAMTRKLGFPDVIMPGDIRNDLYLTLERGDFERGGKSVQKNIEVTVYVLYADGETLKDCFSLGSGEPNISEHRSFVLYHNNSPRWSEVVKLPIPIDRFRGSHLRFEFRHCSTKDKGEKKLFGFSFTPLMRDDGTTLSDESHELYVYKVKLCHLSYCPLSLSVCVSPLHLIFQRSTKETLWISTQLSSTKLTQNVDLLALLKWKAHPDRVTDILGRLRHVNGEEIVKFLQDILDTLFSILDDNTDKYGPLVFQSLVFIINLLRDSKYYHFRPVMDTYIQKHFAGALAYKELIRCLKWYMDRSAEVVRQDHIQEAMRALEYLFKFIVQSRILYSRATCGMEEEQFRVSIQELFLSIRFVLSLDSRSSETLIFTQAALLNSFPAIFDELLQMFTAQEVAEFVRGTLGSMPSTVHIGQSMDVVKLQSIARTVDSRLFSFPDSRRTLLPVVLHHIHLHLRQQKELLICSGILSSIFSIIKSSSMVNLPTKFFGLLVDLCDWLTCVHLCSYWQGEYVSCLLSLLRQMSDIHFQNLLDNFQSKEELKEFLLKIFCVFRNLMKLSIFPRDWNVMRHIFYTSTTPLPNFTTSSTPLPHLYHTSTTPLLHLYHTSTTPLLQLYHTSTTPLPHLFYTSTKLLLHLYHTSTKLLLYLYHTSTKLLLYLYHTSTTPLPNFFYTSTTPLPHLYHTSTKLLLYLFHTSTTPLPHLYHTSTKLILYLFHTSSTPLPHLYQTSPPLLHFYHTSTTPLPHLYQTSSTPLLHLFYTSTTPLPNFFYTSTTPLLHLYHTSTKLHHLFHTSSTPLPHLYYTSTTPLPNFFYTSSTPLPHLYHTSTKLLLHLYHTSSTPLPHLYQTSPPLPHLFYTSTTPLPNFTTSSTPLLHLYHTSTTPLPHLFYTSSTPLPHLYYTSTTPLPNFFYTSTTPLPNFTTSSTPLPHLFYTSTTPLPNLTTSSTPLSTPLSTLLLHLFHSSTTPLPHFQTSSTLLLHLFHTSFTRKKVLDKYGDMRVMMAYELFSMWQNLGENKVHFIPGMIGPFLGVTLVPQTEVRNIMIPIFHDMMDWEQRKNGNFKQVEAELIDKLDSLVSEGKGDENYRELFSLTQLFGPYPSLLEKIEQETWRETGTSFVTSVTRLMERLLDYRDCMKGDETENKKIGCTVNLLNFYKSEINKEEMYIRYIHKLCDMHLQAENYTEAAFTLLLYWELLHWEERPLRDFLHYPAQSQWHRKEGLCRKVIHYFNKGKCWEYGIPLCRELAFQYETLYDYQSLSWIRKMEAAYYDNIMEQQRLEPEFFRVGFYGRKFPFFLRNKEFVCRGHDYERLEAFQQRMLGEFPQAIAMQHPNQPDEAILQCDAQYLQIYAVTPVPENINVLQMDRVPDRIKSFYRVNNVRRFRYDRPFHKGSKDRENEFKSLWIERTTLILTHPLPGISRWFEVEKRELVEVSPLENAIYVVENKNHELRTLISQYQHKQLHGNINLLSMCLNGVIDAAVNGGIARYQEAFFDKDYISSHPEDTEKITALKDLMQEQLHILGVGLAVHDKLVHPEMRPLHKKLIDQFQVMRSSLYVSLVFAFFQTVFSNVLIEPPSMFFFMFLKVDYAVFESDGPPESAVNTTQSSCCETFIAYRLLVEVIYMTHRRQQEDCGDPSFTNCSTLTHISVWVQRVWSQNEYSGVFLCGYRDFGHSMNIQVYFCVGTESLVTE